MQQFTADDPETKSADVVADNVDALKGLFPDAFTEGRVDFEVLKQLLGGAVDERDEKYGLTWHGKRAARQLALTPSTGTLRPCPDESVDWDTTQNLMIEGDNLEVLKLLQKSYTGKVKLIYIDPPYNTGNDFVYPDDFRDSIANYLTITGQRGENAQALASNPESSGRFHTHWLTMIYPRLRLARELLAEDGVICVSIDGSEHANLRLCMDEVFGEENSVSDVVWKKRVSPANDAKWFSTDHDILVFYAKRKDTWRPSKLARSQSQEEYYKNPDDDPRGPWNSATYTCNKSSTERPNLYYPITNPTTGQQVWPKKTAVWKYGEEVARSHAEDDRLYWGVGGKSAAPRVKLFLSEMSGVVPRSVWDYEDVGHTQEATAELRSIFNGEQTFSSPKPVRLMRRILDIAGVSEGDISLDFFAGSGTLAQAVMEKSLADENLLRYVLVQIPEPTSLPGYPTIAHITRERLRRSGLALASAHPGREVDSGFRSLRLDSTNIRAWSPDRGDLDASLTDAIEHLKDDRSEQDILFELLLKLGLDLTVPIETRKVAGKTLYSVGVGTLLVCLAESIAQDDIEAVALGIAAWHDELDPAGDSTVVFRDSAFADDVAKTNLTAILEQHGLSTVRSL